MRSETVFFLVALVALAGAQRPTNYIFPSSLSAWNKHLSSLPPMTSVAPNVYTARAMATQSPITSSATTSLSLGSTALAGSAAASIWGFGNGGETSTESTTCTWNPASSTTELVWTDGGIASMTVSGVMATCLFATSASASGVDDATDWSTTRTATEFLVPATHTLNHFAYVDAKAMLIASNDAMGRGHDRALGTGLLGIAVATLLGVFFL